MRFWFRYPQRSGAFVESPPSSLRIIVASTTIRLIVLFTTNKSYTLVSASVHYAAGPVISSGFIGLSAFIAHDLSKWSRQPHWWGFIVTSQSSTNSYCVWFSLEFSLSTSALRFTEFTGLTPSLLETYMEVASPMLRIYATSQRLCLRVRSFSAYLSLLNDIAGSTRRSYFLVWV